MIIGRKFTNACDSNEVKGNYNMECFVTFISHVFHETKHIEMLIDPADL